MPRYVCIDIEATSIDGAAEYLEPVSAPANYKDADKIKAYMAEAQRAALDKCALDPDLARIVAIGISIPEMDEPVIITAKDEAQERELLRRTWEAIGTRTIIGYNVLGYDLLVLLRRSLYLGVPALPIQVDKYRHPQVIDLIQVTSFNGAIKFRGLKFYAKRLGLKINDAIQGKDIPALVAAGKWDEVNAHVKSDVELTVALARELGVIPKPVQAVGAF